MVTGEVEHSLAMLLERVRRTIPPHARVGNSERWRARHEKAREALRAEGRASGSRKTIETRWVAHELNEVLPDDAVVVDETINHRLYILRYLDRLTPGRFFEASHGGAGTALGGGAGGKGAGPHPAGGVPIGGGRATF